MALFRQIKEVALRKGYRLLLKKGANCPECGVSLSLPAQMPEGDDLFQCSGCAWSGGLFDLMASGEDWEGLQQQQPAGSKIIKHESADSVRWLMPASKRPNFLCFFALLWLGFISFFTVMMFFAESDGEQAPWVMWLFLLPFWGVGIGVAYWGLRMMLMESILMVNQDEVHLMQKLFGKVKFKKLSRSGDLKVERYKAYEQNDTPVYGLCVQGAGKDKLKFGSRLKEDDKRWMLSELREVLEPKRSEKSVARENASPYSYGGSIQLVSYENLPEIEEKGLELKRVGREGFRIERAHLSGKWFILGGLIGIGVSGFLLIQASDLLDVEFDDFFDLIDVLFGAVPFIMALIFGGLGLGAFVVARHYIGLVEQFEFSAKELVVKKRKNNQKGKESRYPKDVFHSVTSRESGHVNNEPRYSVSLKGRNKRVAIVSFVKRDVADNLVAWIDAWLGH